MLAKIVEAILLDKPANPIGYITYMANIFLENFPEETRDVAAGLRREKPPDLVVTTTPGDEERSEAVFVPDTHPAAPGVGERRDDRVVRRGGVPAQVDRQDTSTPGPWTCLSPGRAPARTARRSRP